MTQASPIGSFPLLSKELKDRILLSKVKGLHKESHQVFLSLLFGAIVYSKLGLQSLVGTASLGSAFAYIVTYVGWMWVCLLS